MNLTELIETDFTGYEGVPRGRCNRCAYQYGRPKPEHAARLRCPDCDYPFGETVAGMRAIALPLATNPKERVNVYSSVVCYVWLKLRRDFLDLDVETDINTENWGVIPDWLDYELSNIGWGDIISPEHRTISEPDILGTWNGWAMREGLCPGQAFLVEMKKPSYFKSGYEYEEWDVEYDWDIIAVEKKSPKQAALAWDRWWKLCVKEREGVKRTKAAHAREQQHKVDAMRLERSTFWHGRYDEMSAPDGLSLTLLSTIHGGARLAEGRAHIGEDFTPEQLQQALWDRLVVDAKQRLPHLNYNDLATIRAKGSTYR